jgi:hypothetical protein
MVISSASSSKAVRRKTAKQPEEKP